MLGELSQSHIPIRIHILMCLSHLCLGKTTHAVTLWQIHSPEYDPTGILEDILLWGIYVKRLPWIISLLLSVVSLDITIQILQNVKLRSEECRDILNAYIEKFQQRRYANKVRASLVKCDE